MTDPWTPLIALHAVAASYALLLGPVQILRRKGDRPHRWIGWSWTAAMAVVVVTSFWILEADGFLFWFLHGLAVLTACTVTLGIVQARRGRIASHRGNMVGSYLGLVGAFVGVVAVPTRRVDETAVSDPYGFAVVVGVLVVTAAVWVVVATRARTRPR